jgi:hypothetical protein
VIDETASVERPAWGRAILRSAATVIAVLAAIEIGYFYLEPFGQRFFANDLNGYLAGARRFLESGSPYLAEQVNGNWTLQPDSFIHPPIALLLFIPFLVLPAVLWWAVPLGLTVWAIVRMRPAVWAWPLMALCLLWPRTAGILIAGNTDMWVSAAIAVALAASLPTTVLLIMKPSYLPFALIGLPWRSWWIAGAAISLAAAAFAALWFDYVKVLRGVTLEPLYSLYNAPFVLVPVIAWIARTRRQASPRRIWMPRRTSVLAAEPKTVD